MASCAASAAQLDSLCEPVEETRRCAAAGERVAKGTGGFSCDMATNVFTLTHRYVLDLAGRQMTEYDGSIWAHTNVFADGQLLATYRSTGTPMTFDLNDWLGTRRVTTDYAGVVEQTCASLPYGYQLNCTGSFDAPNEQHFTAKTHDTESGLDYFGARYYSENDARFMSPDPAGLHAIKLANPQTWNLYVYTLNNPLRYTDPTGMYLCADNAKCNTAADKAFEAARQTDLKSKNNAVAAAAAAYGDPMMNNHVTVQFTNAKNGETTPQFSINGKALSYSITVSIPKSVSGIALDALVDHEGTHTEQYTALFGSFKPDTEFSRALDLSHYSAENAAYHNQASVWQSSGYSWTMTGRGQFVISPTSSPSQVSNTINQFLADPANGYGGLTPQNPGGLLIKLP